MKPGKTQLTARRGREGEEGEEAGVLPRCCPSPPGVLLIRRQIKSVFPHLIFEKFNDYGYLSLSSVSFSLMFL